MNKKEKVAILTFAHTSNMNFGAMLQSYALYETIKELGYDPHIIEWRIKKQKGVISFSDIDEQYSVSGRVIRYLRRIVGFCLADILKKKSLKCGENGFVQFKDKYMPNRTPLVNLSNIDILNDDYGIFVVGSDQVWRYKTCPRIYTFFLDFVSSENKKIAYAPSFGIDAWSEAEDSVTTEIKQLLHRFNAVSVREKSGIEICKSTFDIDSTCVVDPTLLISRKNYDSIIGDSHTSLEPYIALMKLDSKSDSFALKVEDKLKVKVEDIRGDKRSFWGREMIAYISVPMWLRKIRDAEFVLTDSFHCAVFSIIFQKNFAVIVNTERGSTRLVSLLTMIGLESRLFASDKDFLESDVWKIQPDYKTIDAIIDDHKARSLSFLKDSLKS